MPKFLIIRFSSIGDIVLTSAVVRCMKKQIPEAEIHYLTKRRYASLLAYNPYITKVYCIDDELSTILPALKQEKYDSIIDLHKNLRSLRVKLALGIKTYSFDKLNLEKWLLVNFKIDRMPKLHLVDRYFEGIASLNIQNDGDGLDYFFAPQKNLIPANFTLQLEGIDYAAWAIGGTHFTKRLPQNQIIKVANNSTLPIVLLGGKEEESVAEEIEKSCSKVINACGKTDFDGSAAIMAHAKLILTNDTGMMHIAAALKKRIISFWGNTVPELGMTAYLPIDHEKARIVENKNLNCRPCSKLGFAKCPKGHFKCMNDLELVSL